MANEGHEQGAPQIMSSKSLEDLIQASGNPVDMLRNLRTGPNPYPGIPPEFTNWPEEQ